MGIKPFSLLSNRKNKNRASMCLFSVDYADHSLTSIRARCDVSAELRCRAALVWHPFPPGCCPPFPHLFSAPRPSSFPHTRILAQHRRLVRVSWHHNVPLWSQRILIFQNPVRGYKNLRFYHSNASTMVGKGFHVLDSQRTWLSGSKSAQYVHVMWH